MMQHKNFVVEDKPNQTWIHVCYIDDDRGYGLQLIAFAHIMNKVTNIEYNGKSDYRCIYCMILKKDLPKFETAMEELMWTLYRNNYDYFRYCDVYLANLAAGNAHVDCAANALHAIEQERKENI